MADWLNHIYTMVLLVYSLKIVLCGRLAIPFKRKRQKHFWSEYHQQVHLWNFPETLQWDLPYTNQTRANKTMVFTSPSSHI